MKHSIFFLLIIFSFFLISQQLEITAEGQSYFVQSSPDEKWLIVKDNDQFQIYEEDFDPVTTFNLGAHQNSVQWIYGAARDFDTDNNIEVLYQANDNGNYSVFLKDISTTQIQLQYTGTSSYWYYCFSFGYLGNERIFVISRYNLSSYTYDVSYIYRSGNPQNAVDEPFTPIRKNSIFNYPNPFSPNRTNSGTTIKFDLGSTQKASLNIYNAKGQLVKNLIDFQFLPKGENTIFWNGLDENSKPCPSGIYFYKLETADEILIDKSLIIN